MRVPCTHGAEQKEAPHDFIPSCCARKQRVSRGRGGMLSTDQFCFVWQVSWARSSDLARPGAAQTPLHDVLADVLSTTGECLQSFRLSCWLKPGELDESFCSEVFEQTLVKFEAEAVVFG